MITAPHQPPAVSASNSDTWTAADSAALYGLDRWGDPYFSVSDRGHVMVQPRGDRGGSLDLVELVQENGVMLVVLVRILVVVVIVVVIVVVVWVIYLQQCQLLQFRSRFAKTKTKK